MCRVNLRSIQREKPRMNTEDKDIIALRIEMLEFVIKAVLRFAEEDDTGASRMYGLDCGFDDHGQLEEGTLRR